MKNEQPYQLQTLLPKDPLQSPNYQRLDIAGVGWSCSSRERASGSTLGQQPDASVSTTNIRDLSTDPGEFSLFIKPMRRWGWVLWVIDPGPYPRRGWRRVATG
jgi:hypothetical protein